MTYLISVFWVCTKLETVSIVYVPQKLYPATQKYLDNHSSLYKIYETIYHYKLGNGKIKLEAELPSALIQGSLRLSHDSPVLKMECTTMLEDKRPLYFVECCYIGEKYFSYDANFTVPQIGGMDSEMVHDFFCCIIFRLHESSYQVAGWSE